MLYHLYFLLHIPNKWADSFSKNVQMGSPGHHGAIEPFLAAAVIK